MPAEVILHDAFVEVVFSGEVARGQQMGAESLAHVGKTGLVLFDFSGITKADFDPMQLGEGMVRLAARGVRLAICSTNPAYFGFGRQISLYSGLEGQAIATFSDRNDAILWLLRSPAAEE